MGHRRPFHTRHERQTQPEAESHQSKRHSERDLNKMRSKLLYGIGVPEPQPFVPDEFQLQAIESVKRGDDTLVIAPTGAGKTYIAFEAIRHALERGERAVYTAPLKALSNAKYAELKKQFEPRFSVGLLTGDRKIEGGANVVVATAEIYRNELYSYGDNYSLVILDELHYLADPQRGPVWEESIILSAQKSVLLMLSASISNAKELASWIQEIRNKQVSIVQVVKRPVELRYGFLHPQLGVIPLAGDQGELFHEVYNWYRGGQEFFLPGRNRSRR